MIVGALVRIVAIDLFGMVAAMVIISAGSYRSGDADRGGCGASSRRFEEVGRRVPTFPKSFE